MSPTLSLRRSSKTDPEPNVDQLDDLEDLPPVADGRHQTTSALGAKEFVSNRTWAMTHRIGGAQPCPRSREQR